MNKKEEIFTIGDKTTLGIITCFRLLDNEIMVDFNNKNSILLKSKQLQHIKTPLFTTEDGVDIFEGDSYYAVNTTFFNNYGSQKAFNKKSPDLTPFWQSNRSVCKYFSTKEKAEEYILMNKVCLSLNDLLKDKGLLDSYAIVQIKKLVKSKL